jgi:DNA-binding CsgD family transcriptional regulator
MLVNGTNRTLSPRQEQIIGLIVLGLTDKEIGVRLALSPHTVRTYIDRVYRTLGCRNRTRAVAIWLSREASPSASPARPYVLPGRGSAPDAIPGRGL